MRRPFFPSDPQAHCVHISCSCGCPWVGSFLVVWMTKKQPIVAKSSGEAKVRAMASTVQEVLWLRSILWDFDVLITSPILLHHDSSGAFQIAADPIKHELT